MSDDVLYETQAFYNEHATLTPTKLINLMLDLAKRWGRCTLVKIAATGELGIRLEDDTQVGYVALLHGEIHIYGEEDE